ncbi:hypothetical protein EDD18DRAFT_1197092 [Armillaria luteobubalina]|uniref:Transmembrane protein n=1 Tax=Armillaria luteobubalina TaxID=153913 RepID=A0AA39UM25_9AGAR|nr:hypothetical protein EDD18DRAFT_1197092 [Armillaria luteobubalina]
MVVDDMKPSSQTPPPSYAQSTSSGVTVVEHPGPLPSGLASTVTATSSTPFPSIFTPPNPQELHLPYAYYDPRSEYSVALADHRARMRFLGSVLYAAGVWVLFGILVGWWGQAWSE